MDRDEFQKRFCIAVNKFSGRRMMLRDELGAYAEAARAGLPRRICIPHKETIMAIIVVAHSPSKLSIMAEKAYQATLPWWQRCLITSCCNMSELRR